MTFLQSMKKLLDDVERLHEETKCTELRHAAERCVWADRERALKLKIAELENTINRTQHKEKPTHCPECGEEFYVYQNCARCNPAF